MAQQGFVPSPARQRGFTLIETMIVIVLAILAIVAISAGSIVLNDRLQTQRLVTMVHGVDDAIKTTYLNEYAYTGLTLTTIWGALSPSLRTTSAPSTSLPISAGGTLTVEPRRSGASGPFTRYAIVLNDVSASTCVTSLTHLGGDYPTVLMGAGNSIKEGSRRTIMPGRALRLCSPDSGIPPGGGGDTSGGGTQPSPTPGSYKIVFING